jgi:hypothetical protein
VVVVVGETVKVAPLPNPVHVYETPPVAVSVVDCPIQIDTSVPALIGAFALTVTTTASVAVQPAEVPVTVYVVVVEGETVIDAVVCPPGLHE